MNITITDINGSMVYILPHVPNGIEITTGSANETMETLAGNIRVVGENELKSVSWSALFPVNKNYSWQKIGSLIDGGDYVKFLEAMKKAKMPVRVVITDNRFKTVLNALMSIDSFTYQKDKARDYAYSITLTEFPEDRWEFLNNMMANKLAYAELQVKSATKKALMKHGLLGRL